MGNMNSAENGHEEELNYEELYQTKLPVRVIKKDGSTEAFHIQKLRPTVNIGTVLHQQTPHYHEVEQQADANGDQAAL